MKLNKEQKKIVDTVFDDKIRFVNVYAGPGSGKSTMIAYLISEFIDKRNYFLEDFICISFTNESWKELRDKIIGRCDNIPSKSYKNLTITTFHKYCAALCKEDIDYNNKFNKMLTDLKREEERTQKNELLDRLITDASDVLNVYSKLKAEGNAQDDIQINEDMLMKKVLFLDEAQDFTHDIYEFVCSLMSAVKYAIGADLKVYTFSDPDQSIFEYEGANHEYIKDLMEFAPKSGKETGKKLRDVKELFLTSNFRSNEKIVGFTEDYRKIALPDSPRKDGKNRMNSATGKKGLKNSVKFYEVKEGACCNAIIDVIKDKIENKKFKSGGTIGILVPKNDESYNIYEILKKEYIDNLNITVRITGNRATSFKIIMLDEFHSLIRIIYEALSEFDPLSKNGKAIKSRTRYENTQPPMIPMDDVCIDFYAGPEKAAKEYNLKRCIEKFEEAYKTSKYKNAVIELFDEFRKDYEGVGYYDLKKSKDKINDGKNRVFDQTELDKFIELLYQYDFDAFCCDFVDKKRTTKKESPQIEIMVSTIHKAKGHEFDYVFMACLDNYKKWLNEKDVKGFEKCRYVAMTRAKSELHIFNDSIEDNYCPKFDIHMAKNEVDNPDSVILSPKDLALSYLTYRKRAFTFEQFIPYSYKEAQLRGYIIDDNIQCMFDDTPVELQAGTKLQLENILSTNGYYRFVFYNEEKSVYLERLSAHALGDDKSSQWLKFDKAGNSSVIREKNSNNFVIRTIEMKYRECYKRSEEEELENSNEKTWSQIIRSKIDTANEHFKEWCKNNLDIEIEAIVILDGIKAPWYEDGRKYEEFLQDYRFYSDNMDLYEDGLRVNNDRVKSELKNEIMFAPTRCYYEYDRTKRTIIKKKVRDNEVAFSGKNDGTGFFRRKLIIPKITLKNSSNK